MKRLTIGILAAALLASCVAQPSTPTPPPTNARFGSASPEATLAPRPEVSQQIPPSVVPSPSDPTGAEVILPTPPPGTAGWSTCTTFQLEMTGTDIGAAAGNMAALVRLRNVSHDGCRLDGYPDIRLVSRTGEMLPTTERHAVTGAYMFPAIPALPVALGSGDTASFEIAYTDNPFGGGEDLPYDQACPPTRSVRVVIPGTHQFGTAELTIAPCEGVVDVSPIYPGSHRLEFP